MPDSTIFNFAKYVKKNRIDTAGAGGRHFRKGWINIPCPICRRGGGNHLGYNLKSGYFFCWSCGSQSITNVIRALEHCSYSQAKNIIAEFQTDNTQTKHKIKKKENRSEVCCLPPGTEAIKKKDKAYNYITKVRNLSENVISEWNLLKTPPIGKYKSRIVFPFYYRDQLVTFQTRDYTNKQGLRYLSCPKQEAVMDVKETLFGYDTAKQYNSVIVVEGVFDAVNIGHGAVATCGTSWTDEQVCLLAEWDEIIILFDPNEKGAMGQAKNLKSALDCFDKKTSILVPEGIDCDPAELPKEYINELRRLLF